MNVDLNAMMYDTRTVKFIETKNNKMMVFCGAFSIAFDTRYGEKGYPFSCLMRNVKFSNEIVSTIEASKILKVDPDFSYYSQPTGNSILYLVPQADYSLDGFKDVLCDVFSDLILNNKKEE